MQSVDKFTFTVSLHGGVYVFGFVSIIPFVFLQFYVCTMPVYSLVEMEILYTKIDSA